MGPLTYTASAALVLDTRKGYDDPGVRSAAGVMSSRMVGPVLSMRMMRVACMVTPVSNVATALRVYLEGHNINSPKVPPMRVYG